MMGKKKADKPAAENVATTSDKASTATPDVETLKFPKLYPKEDLQCRVVLDDQILVIDNIFSAAECKSYVEFIDELPLQVVPTKRRRNEADRVNYRISLTSVEFAETLHQLLLPHLPPTFSSPSWVKSPGNTTRLPHSFNSNIRLYKYTPSQYFGPHYDDSVRDPETGARSEWTLLIYLTGVEDGVEGGETVFYHEVKGKTKGSLSSPLTRGTALLHRHGQDCMLHEGSVVLKGTKYVLRSDLMFMH